jgi:squalene-hopene/tetraprenyl-beta-curcumene cyclase
MALGIAVTFCGCSSERDEKVGQGKEPTPRAAPAPRAAVEDDAARAKRYEASLRKAAGWLLKQSNEDGSFGKHAPVGMTGLVFSAVLSSPDTEKLRTHPVVVKGAAYLLSMQQPDGSINEPGQKGLANYQTSAALAALVKLGDPAHQEAIKKARDFLLRIQRDDSTNKGGWGYNRDKRADLSNTQMTLEALKAAGLDENSEAFKRCVIFLQRCQNRSESSDQPYAGNDGGAMYYPGSSKAGTITLPNGKVVHKSYGSMTYALLRCFLLVGLKPDDPRVVGAQKWLAEHFRGPLPPRLARDQDARWHHVLVGQGTG